MLYITLLGGFILTAFVVGINIGTFLNTRKWLQSHSTDWYWEDYKKFRKSEVGSIVYYLGYPGTVLARKFYSDRQY